MKQAITLRLCLVIILSMFMTTFLSYYILMKSSKEAMYQNSLVRIKQIAQIMEENDADVAQLKEDLKEDYFIRAKAAAYIIQNHSEVIGNLEEMRKIVSLLQIDELHLFDKEGTLFTGSEPKYYNYTFHSGEQMEFFLPMLEDESLQLCQEVTPNTAEGKMMQYLAVWREDKQGIVQIGMEPKRLLEAMEKNELSHIFAMLTAEKGITIFAADGDTGEILGASDTGLVGKNASDIGLDLTQGRQTAEAFNTEVNGNKSYTALQQAGRMLIGISCTYDVLYRSVSENMALMVVSLFVLSTVIIGLILMMLDQFIIKRIYEMIRGMKKIAAGDLDYHVEVMNLPEFAELSNNINSMVKSLLDTTNKFSLVFQNVKLPIAVYEYNPDMKRVLATSKIGDILMLSEQELLRILSDQSRFHEKIQQICANPYEQEKDVYQLPDTEERFVRINSYQEGRSTFGIVVDVTEDILEKREIKQERDLDLLTGIFNRRAFYHELDRIFQEPETIGIAAFLMIDLDNLKYVNDHWGHEYGDRLLSRTADLLMCCRAPHKVVSRFGGDEFVMLVYGTDSQAEIQEYFDELYTASRKAFICMPNQTNVPVRMSGGFVFYPEYGKDFQELLHLADQAMYQVKNSSKGCFQRYRPEEPAPQQELR